MASDPDMIEQVAQACRVLGKLDITYEARGHVSWRLGDSERMLIKGKGNDQVGLRFTQPEDILEVDFNADKVAGNSGLQPPSESYLHLWVYKTNPEARCVIHMHPKEAVMLTMCNKEIKPFYGLYGAGDRLAIQGVSTYPRSITIHNNELGKDFATFMGQQKVMLMRGHGITVSGRSVIDASLRTVYLNELTTMTYGAYLIGEPQEILPEDLEELRKPAETSRARGSSGGDVGDRAHWRYYCMLTGEEMIA